MQTIDQNKNFRAGLVVDDPAIRNPYHYDFFLQSHRALKGTARPCHYFVIHNDMKLGADQLQRITFGLCWTFARALTPISYASPAYYADLLAERGRCYLAPFLSPAHVGRPPDHILFRDLDVARATQQEKDLHVLAKVKARLQKDDGQPAWSDKNANPFHENISSTMFYI